jgi:hypothetical protein
MRILRTTLLGVGGVAMAGWVAAAAGARAQSMPPMAPMHQPMKMDGMSKDMAMRPMTRDEKIANAMSAAPAAVSAGAAIMDWPAMEGQAPAALRAGTNGWTCLPDMPETKGNDPVCLDKSWMAWVQGYMTHTAPRVPSVGIAYMTAPGGGEASNTDPFATAATPANQWMHHPPHMMIVVPDVKALEGLPTDPHNGGPYVMYAGTPYAHIMAPIGGM